MKIADKLKHRGRFMRGLWNKARAEGVCVLTDGKKFFVLEDLHDEDGTPIWAILAFVTYEESLLYLEALQKANYDVDKSHVASYGIDELANLVTFLQPDFLIDRDKSRVYLCAIDEDGDICYEDIIWSSGGEQLH